MKLHPRAILNCFSNVISQDSKFCRLVFLLKKEVFEKNQRLRFEEKFPRVVRVIEPQGCLSRECVQMCKCLKEES